jgi:hypothetical protein
MVWLVEVRQAEPCSDFSFGRTSKLTSEQNTLNIVYQPKTNI